jgi:methionyl-tRNA synthetase
MLMAGNVELPVSVFAHGFLSLSGEKMSKTRGNILDPIRMSGIFGTDGLRYILMREVPFEKDGDISMELLVSRYNADLANELGNLFSRTASMITKYFGGDLGRGSFGPDSELFGDLSAALDGYGRHMERMEFSRALGEFWPAVQRANRFIEEKRPWEMAKDEAKRGELERVFRELTAVIIVAGVVLSPFMPEKMETMLAHLGAGRTGIEDLPPGEIALSGITPPEPLFPRIQGDSPELVTGS